MGELSAGGSVNPRRRAEQARKPEPQHGQILALYVVIWDRHVKRELLVPATKLDIAKGFIKLP